MKPKRLCDLVSIDMKNNDHTGSLPADEMQHARDQREMLKQALLYIIRHSSPDLVDTAVNAASSGYQYPLGNT